MHSKIKDMPEGDILVHSGDFTGRLTHQVEDMISLNTWLGTLPYKHKLLVPGNHDKLCEKDPNTARGLLSNGTLLIDEGITIDGIRFWGHPWTPVFGNWYFMKSPGSHMKKYTDKIPEDTDVLISHGPPRGVLDELDWDKTHVGCEQLLSRVLDIKPKVHAFGHIHCARGEYKGLHTHFVNSAICDEGYRPVHRPIVVEI